MNNKLYDVLIVGAGPAGLTASIYASRYKLGNLVIGKLIGGLITWAHEVANFPGWPKISGWELGQKMAEQVKSFGVEIVGENMARILRQEEPGGQEGFKIMTETGKEFLAKTVIVATGTERRKLNIRGEKEYFGKGVSYCTTCDAPFFKEKTVVLVGGSSAACSGAIHLANFARKIYLIYRKSELRAEPIWVEEVKRNPKIEVIYNTNLTRILGTEEQGGQGGPEGQGRVGKVELDNPYQGEKILKTDGVFIEIGGIPASSFLIPLGVTLNEESYVKVNEKMETNIPGLFAAGDVTDKSLILPQAIIACGQGAVAAFSAFIFLKRN